jgi:hypothetical protein
MAEIDHAITYDPISGDNRSEVQSFIEKNKKMWRSSLIHWMTGRKISNKLLTLQHSLRVE